MSINKDNIATRGNHRPVYEYTVGADKTRSGNTGLYFNLDPKDDVTTTDTSLDFQTAVAKLGSIAGFPIFEVPEVANGTVFDVFPGSPAIDDQGKIAFKGNYAIVDMISNTSVSQTGVFYRQLQQEETLAGDGKIYVVANSETEVPNTPVPMQTNKCSVGTTFGSTAPPSAAANFMVFVGYDNEEAPTCGGIYQAEMNEENFPELTVLIDLETTVPGIVQLETFTMLGEGLSYDGSSVAFWGAWGSETKDVTLCCPSTGNKDRRDYCLNNDTDTLCDGNAGWDPNEGSGCVTANNPDGCYQSKTVPVNQGVFVHDTCSGETRLVAEANASNNHTFIFWNYSGKPPGSGNADESDAAEPPRYRSAAFVALSEGTAVVYKMQINNTTVGIFYATQKGKNNFVSTPVIETGQNCTDLDPLGVDATDQPLLVESLAIERDSFRGKYLAIAAACGAIVNEDDEDSDEGDWGGIYLTELRKSKSKKGKSERGCKVPKKGKAPKKGDVRTRSLAKEGQQKFVRGVYNENTPV